jgi:hypothetical protein
MKLLVCGGRDYRDDAKLRARLDEIRREKGPIVLIVGYNKKNLKYQGADEIAYWWAVTNNVPVKDFPPDWNKFGPPAGPRRNSQMAAERPDYCVATPRANGRMGHGTNDMINKAKLAGCYVEILR